ncbi:hypothetical protein KIN20_021435 [Parelaphostrongylus tenuis]|uniref:Uncharacterized protein n=1 Tax=Parelaphostrongylus tenuis TaxID=148309 RepID=A0AAD5N733_PARTN|nr:hypothetical protein KIN20_021435 [Parelaphostrongylus tenuis]
MNEKNRGVDCRYSKITRLQLMKAVFTGKAAAMTLQYTDYKAGAAVVYWISQEYLQHIHRINIGRRHTVWFFTLRHDHFLSHSHYRQGIQEALHDDRHSASVLVRPSDGHLDIY